MKLGVMMSAVMEERSVRGLREIALFGFIVVALFYLISLISFSHEDAGWSHSGSKMEIQNAGGIVGAWLADFSFSFFGVVAFSFPVIIFWQGYLFFTGKVIDAVGLIRSMRWLGLIAAIVSASTFCYLHILRCQIELPRNSGGIIGQELGEASVITFGNSGATLLLIAVFFSGITLYTHISWLRLMEAVGKNTLFFMSVGYKKLVLLYASTSHSHGAEENTASSEPESRIPRQAQETAKSVAIQPQATAKITPVINFLDSVEQEINAPVAAKPVVTKK